MPAQTSFKAWLIDTSETDWKRRVAVRELDLDDLPAGDVTVKVRWSSINYKDALAVTGAGRVIRTGICVPGVDLAGTVASSANPSFREGDKVLATGWGLGELRHGGYAGYARLSADMLTKLPDGLSMRDAMCFGTAGFTAMLSIHDLENCDSLHPGAEVLVTSAGGGVGSISVSLLADMGFNTHAVSRRKNEEYIASLGAISVIEREKFIAKPRSLDKVRWDAALDTAGGALLPVVLSQMKPGRTVVCCGLTAGAEFSSTVMPFILRGIKLHGIDSVSVSTELREKTWARLAGHTAVFGRVNLEEVDFHDIPAAASRLISAKIRGRLVVDVRSASD